MDTKNTITFKIGEETRPVLEIKNLKNSIFAELYQKAFVEINKYVEKVQSIEDPYTYEGINNIFAFIGERGAGKTSCMMSVAKALENNNKVSYESLGLIDSPDSKVPFLQKNTFTNSVLIDPSFFDLKNNILSLIIAHLFKKFRDEASKSSCKQDIKLKREVIECFEKVQKNLKHFLSDDKSGNSDSLDTLVNFAATVDLQKDIKQLVEKYLKFIPSNTENDSANFLVLMIDDIDLHTKHAREMVEQIRKYFIQPNIIVLIAVKIDQLSNVIKNELSQEYKLLIDKNEMSFDLINEMVERYIGKLIPHAQRFYLPDASVYFNSKLKITSDKDTKKEANNELINNDSTYKEDDLPELREHVLSLIYKKTRYLFYNSIDATSYIVPRNLRELRQLISMLVNMNDYQETSKDKTLKEKECLYNKALFRKYFIETWCYNNLDSEGIKHISELFNINNALQINKSCLLMLSSYFKNELSNITTPPDTHSDNDTEGAEDYSVLKDDDKHTLPEYIISFSPKYKKEIERILDINNFNYNISLGDVMAIVDYLNLIVNEDKKRRFLFAIKFFYSVRLYEFYDELTDPINPQPLFPENVVSNENNKSVLRSDILSSYSNFTKLTAGSFFNLDVFELLRKNITSKQPRDKRKINITHLKTLITDRNPLAEFFILCISMRQDNEKKDDQFREQTKIRFVNDFTKASIAWFDLGSVFFNMMDIKQAYRRFDDSDEFFTDMLEKEDSLISRIITKTLERKYRDENIKNWFTYIRSKNPNIKEREDAYMHILPRIQSWVAIRNMEVFDDLKYYFIQNMQMKGTDLSHINQFFNRLSKNYNIQTYDNSSKDDKYQINWSLFDSFNQIITNKKNNSETNFKKVFDYILITNEIKSIQDELNKAEKELQSETDKQQTLEYELEHDKQEQTKNVLLIQSYKQDEVKYDIAIKQANESLKENKLHIQNLNSENKQTTIKIKDLTAKTKVYNETQENIGKLTKEISELENIIAENNEKINDLKELNVTLTNKIKENKNLQANLKKELRSFMLNLKHLIQAN